MTHPPEDRAGTSPAGPAAGLVAGPGETPGTGPPATSQRERILDLALDLMAEHGAKGMSMRSLASACSLNVAAIYHYFPSKADLLRSVIEERQYGLRLAELPLIDATGTPRELLETLITEMWLGSMAEERVWRLLLGESLRRDPAALAVGSELLAATEAALAGWLATLFPLLAPERVEGAVAIIMGQLYTAFMERLFRPDQDFDDVRRRAGALAEVVLADACR